MKRLYTSARFQPGHRYDDYVPATDREATHGIERLVAGEATTSTTGLLLTAVLVHRKLAILGLLTVLVIGRVAFCRH